MPVALRKRSWEDHVTSHSRTQYSYDDLDLVCCHNLVGGDGSTAGRSQRERCASMPECHCQRPGTGACGEDEEGNSDVRMRSTSSDGSKEMMTSKFGGETSLNIEDGTRTMGIQSPQSFCPGSEHNPDEGFGKVDQINEENEEAIDPFSPNALQEDLSDLELLTVAESMNSSYSKASLKDSCMEMRLTEEALKDSTLSTDCGSIVETTRDRSEETLSGECSDKGPSEKALLAEEHLHHCRVEHLRCEEMVNGVISSADVVQKNTAGQDVSADGDVPVCGEDKICESLQTLESSTYLPGSNTNADKRVSKLDTIHEVLFSESGEDVAVLSDCPVTTVLIYSDDVENGLMLQNCPNNEVDKLALISKSSLESIKGTPQINGPMRGNDTSPNVDINDGPEREPKAPEPPVRLRTRKSSREDGDKSRLDSMVLLIMKLDQLDQEIESALCFDPSNSGTSTLKKHIIAEVDLASLDGDESLFSSLCSLNTPHHQSSSSLSSTGPSGTPGAEPKNKTVAGLAEKGRAEIEAKETCTWLRAAGFPQYAQLYEDGQFPIDISSVTTDHDFLDRDAIDALCRRLNTLNKCALMRLEITPQRKRSEDSDDDEPCAISGRWTFQRDSKRWSRLDQLDLDVFSPLTGDVVSAPPFLALQDKHLLGGSLLREGVGASAESVLTDLSEQPEVGSLHSAGSGGRGGSQSTTIPSIPATPISNVATASTTRTSSVASICSSGTSGANDDSLSDGLPSPLEHGSFAFEAKNISGSSAGNKSTRSRAKSFLKRMESLRLHSSSTASKRKKKVAASQGRLEISGPVLKEGFNEDKLRRLNCVDINTLDRNGNRTRSISYSTQTSSGSTGSSQSETSSGSAVSTPSPVTRARSHSTAAGSLKRAGMYLEGFDPFSLVLMQQNEILENRNQGRRLEPTPTVEKNKKNHKRSEQRQALDERAVDEGGVIYFYLPEDHKPGTFPKALADGSPCNHIDNVNHRVPCQGSSTSLDSRLSFYDNVPFPEMVDEEDDEPEREEEEPKMEEVLEQVNDLQRLVSAWSESGPGEEEEEEGDSDSALDSASPCPSSPLQNRLEEAENGSDQESPLGEQDDSLSTRDRRDSGVGASLTRTSRPQKLRWPSFQSSHRPSMTSSLLLVGCQSVLQMNLLQKYSLLKLTALLEKHTPTNKHGFSWAVPKFMKRSKVRDFKDCSVFAVPLQVNVQRSGQPLPQGILQAMRYLRNHCLDQVGLFRKSGVKSRIQSLRQMNESCGMDGCGVTYEGQSAYDVADMLKQYFRDLPEPLFTSKLADTFLQIYQYMPVDQRLQAVRAAVLLLPDESRETLQTLLCFLSDVTASVRENQMTCMNLAVCLAPSLFHLNTVKRDMSSPRVMSRKNVLGKPDQRDLNENLAATHGLAHMIQECRKLFQVPEELSRCRNSYVDQALSPVRLEDLPNGYRCLIKESVDGLMKEAKDRFRGYESCGTHELAELSCRKMNDGHTLRQWKVSVEVSAVPEDILQRILREQGHWDDDLIESRVLETLDSSSEVYQYARNSMAPHLATDYVVLRSWKTDLPKGACALVCMSVDHEAAVVLGVRANVLTSRYLIEPCGPNKSRLTHISRTDCRGHCPEWYNKLYGHLCVSELVRIRDSFTCPLDK